MTSQRGVENSWFPGLKIEIWGHVCGGAGTGWGGAWFPTLYPWLRKFILVGGAPGGGVAHPMAPKGVFRSGHVAQSGTWDQERTFSAE